MDSFRKRANRYYRKLLGLYPEDFTAEYGTEMEALFHERSRCRDCCGTRPSTR